MSKILERWDGMIESIEARQVKNLAHVMQGPPSMQDTSAFADMVEVQYRLRAYCHTRGHLVKLLREGRQGGASVDDIHIEMRKALTKEIALQSLNEGLHYAYKKALVSMLRDLDYGV